MAFDRLRDKVPGMRTYASEEDTSRDVSQAENPHEWDDPNPTSWREKLTPNSFPEWLIAIAAASVIIGLLLNSLPLFQVFYLNPVVLGLSILVATHLLAVVLGMRAGWRKRTEYALSVIFGERSVIVRRGKVAKETDDAWLFESIKSLSPTGFLPEYLQFRDVFTNSLGLGSKRGRVQPGEDTGDAPVRDRLDRATTVKVDTETEGTVLVSHAGGRLLELDDHSPDSDRYTPPPIRPDDATARELANELEKMVSEILPRSQERLQIRGSRIAQLREEAKSDKDPRLQELADINQMFMSMLLATLQSQSSDSSSSIDEDLLRQVEELQNK